MLLVELQGLSVFGFVNTGSLGGEAPMNEYYLQTVNALLRLVGTDIIVLDSKFIQEYIYKYILIKNTLI
jgi:hypothetical protein